MSAPEGYVLVPVVLPPLAVSEIKDWAEEEHGLHLTQARPFWAELLRIVSGMSVDEQEALFVAEKGCAPAPLSPTYGPGDMAASWRSGYNTHAMGGRLEGEQEPRCPATPMELIGACQTVAFKAGWDAAIAALSPAGGGK